MAVIAISGAGAGALLSAPATSSFREELVRSAPEKCPSAHRGLAFYSRRFNEWRAKMGVGTTAREVGSLRARHGTAQTASATASCPRIRYLAKRWRTKSYAARLAFERWREERTLRDFPLGGGHRGWQRAIEEVQPLFPRTSGWLFSCSAAEGGWGRWVGYAGASYSDGLRDSDIVGGPMQYRFSTFTGHYRRAREYVRERRYFLPRALGDYTNAWTSALGQALAAGWARWSGNDNHHWSASFGRGC